MISHFHRKTVTVHEIIAKLLTLSIKIWANLHSAFWVLISSTLHVKMLSFMKRFFYFLKNPVLDRDQKLHAAPCSLCCSNVLAVIFWSLFVSRPSVCFSYWCTQINWFQKKKFQINCFFDKQSSLQRWNLKVFWERILICVHKKFV